MEKRKKRSTAQRKKCLEYVKEREKRTVYLPRQTFTRTHSQQVLLSLATGSSRDLRVSFNLCIYTSFISFPGVPPARRPPLATRPLPCGHRGAGSGVGGIRVGARCGLTAQSLQGKNSIHLQVLAAAYLPVWVAGIRRPLQRRRGEGRQVGREGGGQGGTETEERTREIGI